MANASPPLRALMSATMGSKSSCDREQTVTSAPSAANCSATFRPIPLDPPVTAVDVLAATDAVVPVVEVVDSRIEGWELTAGSAIADNALAARVVHGDAIGDPSGVDLSLEGVVVRRNGERVATGVGADVLGSPARVVAWLADALADRDERLTAGDLISTGSLTELIPFEPGDTVEARFASLGSVTVARE